MSKGSRQSAPRIARVLLRLPAELHRALVKEAADQSLSFNEFCVRRLASPTDAREMSSARTLVVTRATEVYGDRLMGVLVLGSWARGDAAAASDIDVLVAIDPATPLTRDLYRAWDLDPLVCEGRAVDVHVIHPSPAGAVPSSVWCEAAVDGLVWYDRDGTIASRLGEVRRTIAEGLVLRGFAHGQPYWKGAA